MTSFFADYADEITFPISDQSTAESYRTCQRGAYWALKSHQTAQGDEPAIISIPTGGGKTALMMLAAFDYEANRVLVIAPSDSIRTQLRGKFERLEGLKMAEAVAADAPAPEVKILDERPRDEHDWEEYSSTDMVVTLPNSISSEYTQEDESDIAPPPEDMFDLVLVDEAHHSSAPAWEEILSKFNSIPQILLTATPFRRDHDILPGRLIYHYPVDKAHDDDIYHKIKLTTQNGGKEPLIDNAESQLKSFKETNDDATMLVRTDEIEKANDLADEYNECDGLEVTAVHSNADKNDNKKAIQALRTGEIDGVVIVDKFAEGIDIDNLQLAVFHEPPKSLRMTIQLIGRLARQPDDNAAATIIATDDVISDKGTEDAVRQLYYENTGWSEIVPDIIGEYIDPQRWPSNHTRDRTPAAVNEENIELYKTVTVYSLAETDADFNLEVPDLRWDVFPLQAAVSSPFAGYITISTDSPTWGTQTILETQRYDLHLFYAPSEHDFLFEYTSNRRQAGELREALVNDIDDLSTIDGKRLSKVMQSLQNPKYQTTGLTNTTVPSGNQPQYKTYYGEDVQGAVHHSDERTYTHGHVFATFGAEEESETRGVSGEKSKIWANSKEPISDFRSWCDRMADRLSDDSEPGIQNLESLNTGEPIDRFESVPFAIILHPRLAATPIELSGEQFPGSENVKPYLEMESTPEAGSTTVDVVMKFEDYNTELFCSYDVSTDQWTGELAEYDVSLRKKGDAPNGISGDEFLEAYPPRFHTSSGSIVVGGQKQSSQADLSGFVPSEYQASTTVDWSEYISEGANEKPNWYCSNNEGSLTERWDDNEPSSVFEALVQWLKERRHEDQHILFCDDEGGEVADFIEFCVDENRINLYHCKGGYSAGVSLGRFTEIYQQAVRSLRYASSMRLIDHINDRRTPGTLQHFVRGENRYDSLKEDFKPSDWQYTIYGVNPGLNTDFDPEARSEYHNVGRLLSECVEQVEQWNVDFAIQGANDSW
jgi:superfamily II DNA or RNA helicase